ncbi:hypothetical protein TTHERM_00918450 (macronuclear) [Tetrahymena thermophila SB210]|uniref:Uncharacterized protein n=1 Tax=Tetrahymena thermophila (strain SB210) TaxID=312017 RepID=Q24IN0_TETTS|nr:hypothetical protein TTHERM_00918450 [Tetrahymena thermophila SB210]EAS07595.2 hypothetical protein TTHERM_00918450 [Tetrahymena thermophila SB210]|eukprot:XP_001027837.2 hypothetical protein TTHERM_00918450 [Tetrahymena thermophila SB210]
MRRNYIINKAQTQIRYRQYHEQKMWLNNTGDYTNPFAKPEEVNLNDTSSTYYTNKRSISNKPFNSSTRSNSHNQKRTEHKLHHSPDVANFYPQNFSAQKRLYAQGIQQNQQMQSDGEYLQYYVLEKQDDDCNQNYGSDQITMESFQTPQKTKEPNYQYYPDSYQKSISPPKHSQYEKVYQENFSKQPINQTSGMYQEQYEQQNSKQHYLEPAQEVPTIQEESNEFVDQNKINEAYFSINESHIHYSDQETQQNEGSPKYQRRKFVQSKLAQARKRAISEDRNFIDNSYKYTTSNNSSLNNSSWIFYNNKARQIKQANAEQAIFGETIKSRDNFNTSFNPLENQTNDQNQKYNPNLLRQYFQKNKQFQQMLYDVKLQGSRYYQTQVSQKPRHKINFDSQNKNQIKYLNQLSLPKHVNEINQQKQFYYRKCECGAQDQIESIRNLYKKEGRCSNSFYQNSTINFGSN